MKLSILHYVWAILFTLGIATPVFALTADEYIVLDPPRPTDNSGKVEVIEFFWYGCPHCYRFDPHLAAWLKTKPDDVVFKRQPVIFGKHWAPHARAYFTAEVLGVVDKIHKDFFDAMHVKKKPLSTEEELADFFAARGVDKETFKKAFNSFAVDLKMRQANEIAGTYGIDGVPAIAVNGKYKVTGSTAKNYENMIKVMQQLVDQERKALQASAKAQ